MLARGTGATAAGAVVAVCAAGALALAGCSSGGGDGGTPDAKGTASAPSASASPSPSGTPSAPASASAASVPAASASPSPAPDRKLVTMTVTGGFAGVHQEVVLRGDGSVLATGRDGETLYDLTEARFAELRTLLGDPALEDVPDLSVGQGVADMFQYVLRFDGRTVTTDRTSAEPALDALIDALSVWLPPA